MLTSGYRKLVMWAIIEHLVVGVTILTWPLIRLRSIYLYVCGHLHLDLLAVRSEKHRCGNSIVEKHCCGSSIQYVLVSHNFDPLERANQKCLICLLTWLFGILCIKDSTCLKCDSLFRVLFFLCIYRRLTTTDQPHPDTRHSPHCHQATISSKHHCPDHQHQHL